MAIAKRPINNRDAGSMSHENDIEKFIEGAGQVKSSTPKKEKVTKKVGIMVYFDANVLTRVDVQAELEGLSRSSWIQSKSIKALNESEKR